MPSPRLDLLVVADHFRGGLGAAAQAHARWFAGRGWSVALAAAAPVAEEIAPAEAVDVAVPAGAADVRGMVAAARQLRAVLRRRRPRFVHAHGTRSQMLTLLAGRVPYVTMHGAGRVEGQGALGAAVRRTARLVASWLAVRAYSASPAPGRWRTTLHASPSLSGLDRLAASEMADEPTLLWVGRMDAPKRPELFVEACAAAADDLPLRGVMLGGGPRLEEMRALAARLRAPVDVVGESPDVAAHLARAWAVFLFSGFEGVPFAVQEAMWAGRAVVLSPLPSLRWFAGDAAAYASDVPAAAAAMRDLCDRAVAERRGALAAERARDLLVADAPFEQISADYAARR